MALRASFGSLRRVSASLIIAPLFKWNTFMLPSAQPVWTARAGGMSTVSDSQQIEKPEQQQKEKPEQQKEQQKKEPFNISFDIVKVVSTVVVGLAGAAYVKWNYSRTEDRRDFVLETFESGGKPNWDSSFTLVEAANIKRPDLEKKLKELIYPTPDGKLSSSYFLIMGEPGTGKSAAMRRVVREHEGINGAIYVNVPDDTRLFGGCLALAVGLPGVVLDEKYGVIRRINHETEKMNDLPLSEEPSATWARASAVIREAANKFLNKHNRPAVLIIDGVERLAQENPEFLAMLQAFAKLGTDKGCLRVVFVSSDGSVLEQFQSRSTKSWMLDQHFEIGDISDKAAVEFLKGQGVEQEKAEEAVRDITGGRFTLLRKFVESWAAKGTETTRQELFDETRHALNMIKIDERHKFFRTLVS